MCGVLFCGFRTTPEDEAMLRAYREAREKEQYDKLAVMYQQFDAGMHAARREADAAVKDVAEPEPEPVDERAVKEAKWFTST